MPNEQMSTLTAGGVTYEIVDSAARKVAFSEPVNVLSLGVKNDGSEDCSSIINAATENYSLYFPAGIYKVSHTINVKNPIYGAGYSRKNAVSEKFTWLVSDMDSSDALIYISGTNNVNIENLNLKLNEGEIGIHVHDTRQYNKVHNVNVTNVSSHGILVENTTQSLASRSTFIDNCSVFGTAIFNPVSIGIEISGNVGDCRMSNIEVMGCSSGICLNNHIAYMSNVHIWCGCISGSDSNNEWSASKGIMCQNGARLLATNIYIDTAYNVLYAGGNGSCIFIDNFFFTEDSTNDGCSQYEGSVVFTDNQYSRIEINGGYINYKGNSESPSHVSRLHNRVAVNCTFTNVVMVGDYDINIANADKFSPYRSGRTRTANYTLKLVNSTTEDLYVEIAKFPQLNNKRGNARLAVLTDYGDWATIKMGKFGSSQTAFSIERGSETFFDFYYKYDSTIGTIIYIKLPQTSSQMAVYVTVDSITSLQYNCIDYSLIRRRSNDGGDNEVIRETLNSSSGLTKIQ